MESSGQRPPDPEVPLGDAAIATEIANAAARGRGADRAPTLEQLLAAFGEPAPTDVARRRVAAALRVAGMGVRPDLLSAEPGQRLMLLPPGAGGGRSRGRALAGLAAVALVLVAAALGASLLEGKGDDDRASDSLPAGTTTAVAQAPAGASDGAPATDTTATQTDATATATQTDATATATQTDATATATTDTGPTTDTATDTDTDATTTDTTQTTATTPSDDDAAAAERRRKRAARLERQRTEAAARHAAARRKTVTVRVDATARPTFLCVEDGNGKSLFGGTLTGKQVFKARRIRMNIGLASTRVTVNGSPVRLDGSPAGLDITRAGGAKALPLGQRPCG